MILRPLQRLTCLGVLALLGACTMQQTTPPASSPAPTAPATAPAKPAKPAETPTPANDLQRLHEQAMRGDLESQFQLGNQYFVGKPEKNLQQAAYWWKQAADKGHAQAAVSLAFLYTGRADPALADPPAMLKYLNQAAAAGNAMAQHVLGSMYAQGTEGVQKDLYQARALYQSACDKQYAPSCEALKKLPAN